MSYIDGNLGRFIDSEHRIRIYRIMSSATVLSQNFLLDLYLSRQTAYREPVLQILGFETSEQNPKQIVIRLSDGSNFFDATLAGPYEIKGGKIVTSAFAAYGGVNAQFSKFGAIRILDFFSKIDQTKICRLKMMIRKIVLAGQFERRVNRPEELSFYVQCNQLLEANHPTSSEGRLPIDLLPQADKFGPFLTKFDGNSHSVEIKICDDDENVCENVIAVNDGGKHPISLSKQMQILNYGKTRNPEEPMTCRDVMNGEEGFFVGRLVRLKPTFRENKDGSLPMLALGFLDGKGEILRINLLGKTAVREQKQLKKGKCYYLKGLEVVSLKGSSYVKLRERDYKMYVLNEQSVAGEYAQEYYHWEHQYDYIDNENVDVFGVVEDIQEKTFYGVKAVGDGTEPKQVIRVVIRNKFKTVKISFWSDQLKNLTRYNLKKGEVVIVEDVKKKKIVFLDFSTESVLLRLQPATDLYSKFQHLLPEYREYPQATNIREVHAIHQLDRFNTKIHTINVYLGRIQEERLILKVCDLCKKKININSLKCFECKGSVMSFRFNTTVEVNDYSGSMTLTVFDNVAEKLLGVSALRLKEMKDDKEEYQRFMEGQIFEPLQIGVEIKNERFMLRSVERLSEADLVSWCQQSVRQIARLASDAEKGEQQQAL